MGQRSGPRLCVFVVSSRDYEKSSGDIPHVTERLPMLHSVSTRRETLEVTILHCLRLSNQTQTSRGKRGGEKERGGKRGEGDREIRREREGKRG